MNDNLPPDFDPQRALDSIDQLISARGGTVNAIQEALAGRVDAVASQGADTCKRIRKRLQQVITGVTNAHKQNATEIAHTLMGAMDGIVNLRSDATGFLGGRLATAGPPAARTPTRTPSAPPVVPSFAAAVPPPDVSGFAPVASTGLSPTSLRGATPGQVVCIYYACNPARAIKDICGTQPAGWTLWPGAPQFPYTAAGINDAQLWIDSHGADLQALCGAPAGGPGPGGGGGFGAPSCPAGFVLTWSGPFGLWGGRNPLAGRCGIVGVTFQCHGTDGAPAWLVSVLLTDSIGGRISIGGSPNYDPFSAAQFGKGFDGDADAAFAYVAAHFAAWAADPASCPPGGGPVAPPPGQPPAPPPPPAPPGVPAPPPPGEQGAVCETPPTICLQTYTATTTSDCGIGNIPDILLIGSADFCRGIDQLRSNFVGLGRKVIDAVSDFKLSDPFPSVGLTVGLAPPSGPGTVPDASGGVGVNLFSWLNDLVNGLAAVLQGTLSSAASGTASKLVQQLSCWWQLLKTSESCNIGEVIYLAVVKEFINILSDLELGWDIAVWGVKVFHFEIPQLVKVLDYLIANACPDEVPSEGDTIEAWLANQISDDVARCWLSLRGASWDVWYPVVRARREQLTPEEWIQYARRQGLDERIQQTGLRYLGFIDEGERSAKVELYNELPTINDHLLWLQRNVFDPDYVKDFHLLDGFDTDANIATLDPAYAGYFTLYPTGRNFWDAFGHDLYALGMREQYAAYHYAAHWIMPSPGERAEMVFRLRPDAVDPSLVFTQADYVRTLAEQDVAPYFRNRLARIMYRTLPLRQLNAAVQQDRIDRPALIGRWQDIGFSRDDAELMADTLLVQAKRQAASAAHGFTAAVVAKLYPYGLLDRNDALFYLIPQGFSEQQVDDLIKVAELSLIEQRVKSYGQRSLSGYATLVLTAYGDGAATEDEALRALKAAGYPDDAATLELRQEDLKQRWNSLKAAVKSVKYAFMHGEIDATQAASALAAAGVAGPRIGQYVMQWELSMTVPRVAATKAEILRFAKEGIISLDVAATRLANIGVSADTVDLLMMELGQTIAQAKLAAASKKAAALAKARAAALRVVATAQKKLCRLYTPSKMVRWYAERIIEESTFRDRLDKCGYIPAAIDDLLSEAKLARVKADAASAKAAAGPKAKPPPHLAAGRLKSLFAERIIDEATLRAKLLTLGYDAGDAQALIDDAEVARQKKDDEAAAKGPSGIEYTGPGSVTS